MPRRHRRSRPRNLRRTSWSEGMCMCATGATLLGGRRKARRAWRECTGTVAKLTIEEIGVHLLARSVVGVQEGKVVVVYVHVGRKAPHEWLAYDQRGANALLARRHRAGFALKASPTKQPVTLRRRARQRARELPVTRFAPPAPSQPA